jgi:hypothetical protein
VNIEEFKIGDMFVDRKTILFINRPDYKCWLTNNGDGNILVTEEWPDVQSLLDHNAEEAADFSRTSKLRDVVKVASIPLGIYAQWQKEGIDQDRVLLRRKLNDANFAKFRTNSLTV